VIGRVAVMFDSIRRAPLGVVLSVAVLALATSAAQAAPREGMDYTVVKPTQPTTAPAGRVEVIEFFGYWCPACNAFEPTMRDWAKRNEAKVTTVYVPMPTHFRSGEANLQKLYYTLEAMGNEKELRPKIFAAIHSSRTLPDTADAETIGKWVESNGIDKKKFLDTFNSFTVQSKVNRANQMASAYGITGIPSLGIGGKYLLTISTPKIGNADDFVARVMSEK
jgi:protein dithiol oxidoreductase (disulfide-forming)